jgi:hypothetical protein
VIESSSLAAASEGEVEKNKIKEIGKGKPRTSKKDMRLMREDTAIGMAFSQIIMWAIITTTAGSLHTHGVTSH